ncbi:hypothetical protein HPP92_014792, partial [Vanilla planifolia]
MYNVAKKIFIILNLYVIVKTELINVNLIIFIIFYCTEDPSPTARLRPLLTTPFRLALERKLWWELQER